MAEGDFHPGINADDGESGQDFCRVCRCEGASDHPLYHPCLCTGSIKFIHQDCLVQWLRYSKREYCELCKHRFTFTPIYSNDMPKRLPMRVVLHGVACSVLKAVTYWLHYTLVAIAWLGVVPLTACRISRALFTGDVASLVTLPLDLLSTDNLFYDCLHGLTVVMLTLAGFIGYVWLREQILQGGGPDWLQRDQPQPVHGQRRRNQLFPGLFNAFGPGGVNLVGAAPQGQGNANFQLADMEPAGAAVDDQNEHNDDDDDVDQHSSDEEEADDVGGGAGPLVALENHPVGEEEPPPDVQAPGGGNDMDWDRAGDDLTWERLLGLDGSLVFLEHVFWVVSLNTVFILLFAFCPYHIGHFTVLGFKLEALVETTRMEGLVTTAIGYVVLAFVLVVLHFALQLGNMNRARHFAGIGYIVIKVALLSVLEVGVFPIFCGIWMDICSMGMFNATLTQRASVFHYAPVTFVFMHWMVGMMYIFYFASFLLLLRDVLRPGIFWFIRNFNDPEFNPIHDMIVLPVHRHFRRFLINCTLFGTIIVLMLWLPVRVIKKFSPSFLPYTFNISQDTALDYSVEIFFLQVVLPLLFDSHAKLWLKSVVKIWCTGGAWLFDLRSFLLGDEPFKTGDVIVHANGSMTRITSAPGPGIAAGDVNPPGHPHHDNPPAGGAGVGGGGTHFKVWRRPRFFVARLTLLIMGLCLSVLLLSLCVLTLPVECGRQLMNRLPFDTKHDLFALLLGLASLGMSIKMLFSLPGQIMRRGGNIGRQLIQTSRYVLIASRMLLLGVIFLGVVPAALGIIVNFIFITPIRVPMDKTLVIGFWEHWIFGLMHMKAWILLLLVGPRWWMRELLEAVQDEVMRREAMRLPRVLGHASPLLSGLALSLAGPYVIAKSFAPLAGFDPDFVYRRIYPCLFTILVVVSLFSFQLRQFKRLYLHIKNDKYLVGQRLVNYEYK